MDLPTITAGMRLLADDINRIAREVRASAITSVVGGKFIRSQAGTSITIDMSAGRGGGASTTICNFQCTDATVTDNGTKTFRVEVRQQVVLAPNARWPQGMSIDGPPFRITLTESSYIYLKYVYVNNDVIIKPDEDAITIAHNKDPFVNTVNEEYVLIATVKIKDNVLTITNACPLNYPQPCHLNWSASPEPPPGSAPEPPPETP